MRDVTMEGQLELRAVHASYVPLEDVVRVAVDWVTGAELHLLMVDVDVDQAHEILGELGEALAIADGEQL